LMLIEKRKEEKEMEKEAEKRRKEMETYKLVETSHENDVPRMLHDGDTDVLPPLEELPATTVTSVVPNVVPTEVPTDDDSDGEFTGEIGDDVRGEVIGDISVVDPQTPLNELSADVKPVEAIIKPNLNPNFTLNKFGRRFHKTMVDKLSPMLRKINGYKYAEVVNNTATFIITSMTFYEVMFGPNEKEKHLLIFGALDLKSKIITKIDPSFYAQETMSEHDDFLRRIGKKMQPGLVNPMPQQFGAMGPIAGTTTTPRANESVPLDDSDDEKEMPDAPELVSADVGPKSNPFDAIIDPDEDYVDLGVVG
jgi:hypothetical protein